MPRYHACWQNTLGNKYPSNDNWNPLSKKPTALQIAKFVRSILRNYPVYTQVTLIPRRAWLLYVGSTGPEDTLLIWRVD